MENSMDVPYKIKNRATRWPYNLTLGMYLEENMIQKDMHIPMFIETLFTIAQTWKQSKCPLTDE